jgi:hypothetical protein
MPRLQCLGIRLCNFPCLHKHREMTNYRNKRTTNTPAVQFIVAVLRSSSIVRCLSQIDTFCVHVFMKWAPEFSGLNTEHTVKRKRTQRNTFISPHFVALYLPTVQSVCPGFDSWFSWDISQFSLLAPRGHRDSALNAISFRSFLNLLLEKWPSRMTGKYKVVNTPSHEHPVRPKIP